MKEGEVLEEEEKVMLDNLKTLYLTPPSLASEDNIEQSTWHMLFSSTFLKLKSKAVCGNLKIDCIPNNLCVSWLWCFLGNI